MSKLTIQYRRIYDPVKEDDGYRVLVDRIWPRGVRKADAELDEWCRDLAPSKTLRQWFDHDPQRWEGFRQRYLEELDGQGETADKVLEQATQAGSTLTLLYAARDTEYNHAVVLREYLQSRTRSKTRSN